MSDNNKIIFVNMITNLAKTETPFKITFSKPRHKNKEITNVYVKPSIIKNEIQYSFTNRYRYKDEVKNYTAGQLAEVINNLLETMFFNAVSFSDTKSGFL
ncbi:MAG: hypothetical protein IPO98_21955 [Saprospiraceae bacterium]|nr:hypothetical protein [Saprospiraceae bacterium]